VSKRPPKKKITKGGRKEEVKVGGGKGVVGTQTPDIPGKVNRSVVGEKRRLGKNPNQKLSRGESQSDYRVRRPVQGTVGDLARTQRERNVATN